MYATAFRPSGALSTVAPFFCTSKLRDSRASSPAASKVERTHASMSPPSRISTRSSMSNLPSWLLPVPRLTPQKDSPHSLPAIRFLFSVLSSRSRSAASRRNLSRSSACISGTRRRSQSLGSASLLPSACASLGDLALRISSAASGSVALAAWKACSTLGYETPCRITDVLNQLASASQRPVSEVMLSSVSFAPHEAALRLSAIISAS
eukprot:7389489-Prymnesium_polylepis.1